MTTARYPYANVRSTRVTRSFLPSVESQASGAASSLLNLSLRERRAQGWGSCSSRRSRSSLVPSLLDHAPGSAALGDQGETGARPGGHAAIEVLGPEPTQAEALSRAIAARAAPAHRDHDLLLRYLRQTRPELAQG